jgi:hypothetical protein
MFFSPNMLENPVVGPKFEEREVGARPQVVVN